MGNFLRFAEIQIIFGMLGLEVMLYIRVKGLDIKKNKDEFEG